MDIDLSGIDISKLWNLPGEAMKEGPVRIYFVDRQFAMSPLITFMDGFVSTTVLDKIVFPSEDGAKIVIGFDSANHRERVKYTLKTTFTRAEVEARNEQNLPYESFKVKPIEVGDLVSVDVGYDGHGGMNFPTAAKVTEIKNISLESFVGAYQSHLLAQQQTEVRLKQIEQEIIQKQAPENPRIHPHHVNIDYSNVAVFSQGFNSLFEKMARLNYDIGKAVGEAQAEYRLSRKFEVSLEQRMRDASSIDASQLTGAAGLISGDQ